MECTTNLIWGLGVSENVGKNVQNAHLIVNQMNVRISQFSDSPFYISINHGLTWFFNIPKWGSHAMPGLNGCQGACQSYVNWNGFANRFSTFSGKVVTGSILDPSSTKFVLSQSPWPCILVIFPVRMGEIHFKSPVFVLAIPMDLGYLGWFWMVKSGSIPWFVCIGSWRKQRTPMLPRFWTWWQRSIWVFSGVLVGGWIFQGCSAKCR